jgi:(S)-mandelate dehydrogenase
MAWQRGPYTGNSVARALNIDDLRELARRRVPRFVFEYLDGGAEDEATLRGNREALGRLRLLPNTLINTSARHHRGELLGAPLAAPFVIAPTGFNGMIHPEGDLVLARAAAKWGVPFTLSTVSTVRLEEVARQAPGRLWMQLYVMKDRAIAEDIMQRAEAAGFEALVFTSDANIWGSREWDQRSYRAPGKPTLRSQLDALSHPRWFWGVVARNGLPHFRNLESFLGPKGASAVGGSTILPRMFEASICWDDIAWIRRHWHRKLLLKGVLSVADAERAAALGCDGIVISNHGGRQLDSCVAPIDVLPEIAAAVGKRMTLIVDSGFRRGTDVAKGLALGAHAVMLGRSTLYGLAAAGTDGVDRALTIMTSELDRVLGQLGCNTVSELAVRHVRRV